MTWSLEKVLNAFSSDTQIGPNEYRLTQLNDDEAIWIGRGHRKSFVLLMPGTVGQSLLEGRHFKYVPNAAITLAGGGTLNDVGLLEIRYEEPTESETESIAIVFAGLGRLLSEQPDGQRAFRLVVALTGLFESRMSQSIETTSLIGLFGELLVILRARNCDRMVEAWHSRIDAQYDFSEGNIRIEVKTSGNGLRHHHFNSRQLPGLENYEVLVASVLLFFVPSGGISLEILVRMLEQRLSPANYSKLMELVVATLGMPVEAAGDILIDLEGSLSSVRLFAGQVVPTPLISPGVLAMNWEASLPHDQGGEMELAPEHLASAE
jgi:Putative  PD-(D/E)XK family member, (DUF4420)